MSEFDAIVVGGGPAGSSSAIKMASSGLNVLLVERSDPPGSKNVSGGILWGKDLSAIVPDWEKNAPLERYITAKGTGFLTTDSMISIDFRSKKLEASKTGYSVLRAKLDQFLANKAKSSGATLVTGVTVDKLAFDGDRVIGVQQDGDTITSDVVILAEGANPRVAIDSGVRKPIDDRDIAIGIKQVIRLPESTINERFNLRGNQGFAGEYVLGFLQGTVKAGAFMYTNKDTISLGIVVNMSGLRENNSTYSFNIMEQFASHPFIQPYIEGGKVEEYSAHLVCEGGINSVPRLSGNGYMIAGDSAGLTFSNGLVIQGMNYAISSGIAAAETAIAAKAKNNYSSDFLSSYDMKLSANYVLKDMNTFRGIENVTWSNLMHKAVPGIAENVLFRMFNETGQPKEHLSSILMDSIRESKYSKSDLIIEAYRALRRL
jgi:electron transfer flavoprotein-quinone oxidoreductase